MFILLSVSALLNASALHSLSAAMPANIPGEIRVNGRPITAPSPMLCDYGREIILPLRFVAEALGLVVEWDDAERRVDVGGVYSLWIDRPLLSKDGDIYPPPVIVDGRTFVPASFFEHVMHNITVITESRTVLVERITHDWRLYKIDDLQIRLWTYPLAFSERNALLLTEEYDTHYDVFYREEGISLAIWTDTTIYDFEFIEVGLGNTGIEMLYFYPGRSLHTVAKFTPERPFALRTSFGTMPRSALTFLDDSGTRRYLIIEWSGIDGSISLREFPLDVPDPF